MPVVGRHKQQAVHCIWLLRFEALPSTCAPAQVVQCDVLSQCRMLQFAGFLLCAAGCEPVLDAHHTLPSDVCAALPRIRHNALHHFACLFLTPACWLLHNGCNMQRSIPDAAGKHCRGITWSTVCLPCCCDSLTCLAVCYVTVRYMGVRCSQGAADKPVAVLRSCWNSL